MTYAALRPAAGAAALALLASCGGSDAGAVLDPFRAELRRLAGEAEAERRGAVAGLDGWLFSAPELRRVSLESLPAPASDAAGSADAAPGAADPAPGAADPAPGAADPVPGDDDPAIGTAAGSPAADPVAVILDAQRRLAASGVELLLVPVPPKAVVFPEKVSGALTIPIPVPRLDPALEQTYDRLRAGGVDVLDLTDLFIRERFHAEGPLYCRTDTHWSGSGCTTAAAAIAAEVRARPWYATLATESFGASWYSISISGDLTGPGGASFRAGSESGETGAGASGDLTGPGGASFQAGPESGQTDAGVSGDLTGFGGASFQAGPESGQTGADVRGDLTGSGGAPAGREELRLRGVVRPTSRGPTPVAPDPESPILLIGDSHALVFHAGGDLHAAGAGLPDQLAFELGVPVDLAAAPGPAAAPFEVLRERVRADPGYWSRKRLVIWCFAAHALGAGGAWRPAPIVP